MKNGQKWSEGICLVGSIIAGVSLAGLVAAILFSS